jgi:hypothetical protein
MLHAPMQEGAEDDTLQAIHSERLEAMTVPIEHKALIEPEGNPHHQHENEGEKNEVPISGLHSIQHYCKIQLIHGNKLARSSATGRKAQTTTS